MKGLRSQQSRDGQPIEPIWTKEAFSAQCGVLARDKILISIHQWFKPKKEDPEVSYVNDMQKDDLWTELKANFMTIFCFLHLLTS